MAQPLRPEASRPDATRPEAMRLAGTGAPKLHTLQYVRAVAALVVVLFHAWNDRALGMAMTPHLHVVLQTMADAAVDVFFILSGFIMVYTQDRARRSAPAFAAQRIARIVPLYWLTTIAFSAFVLLSDPATQAPAAALAHLRDGRNYLAASMMFISHVFGYKYPVVLPGWSLEYEMAFYAVFSAAILVWKRNPVPLAVAALAALVFAGLLRPLCIEFAIGCMVAVLYRHGHHGAFAALTMLAAPAVVAVGLVGGYYARIDGNDWFRLAFCGVPMLAVFTLALIAPQRELRPLLMLGDASYAIYVSHCAWLLVFIRLVVPHLGAVDPGLMLVLGFACAVAGGLAAHFWLERPLAAMIASKPGRQDVVPPSGIEAIAS